jgi:hypothetical protein
MPSQSYESDFEYEDDEGFEDDEGLEDDEGFEDDEAFEDDETYGAESGLEDDEGFEDDEAFEDDEGITDEAFEDDEGITDEAARVIPLRVRRQAAMRAQVKGLAADRRVAAQRAVTAQRNIVRRLGSIRTGGKVKVQAPGRLYGSGVLQAELPNGRRTKMRLTPAPAFIKDVNKLAARIAANDKRQARAEAANASAIKKLAAAQATAVKQLTTAQLKNNAALSKRLAAGDARLEARITKELTGKGGIAVKQRKALVAAMRTTRRRSIWNGILMATSMPFFAAYGERNNPFSYNNLVLTGSLAGWMLADEIVDQFTGRGSKPGMARTASDFWSYLAPVGNGLTAYLTMRNRQHERFVTQLTKVKAGTSGSAEPIEVKVGSSYKESFEKLENVRAVATLKNPPDGVTGVSASVTGGKLTLTLLGDGVKEGTEADVYWAVDTRDPSAT